MPPVPCLMLELQSAAGLHSERVWQMEMSVCRRKDTSAGSMCEILVGVQDGARFAEDGGAMAHRGMTCSTTHLMTLGKARSLGNESLVLEMSCLQDCVTVSSL